MYICMYVPGGEKGRRLSVTMASAIGQNDAGGQDLLLVELERKSAVFFRGVDGLVCWVGRSVCSVGWSVCQFCSVVLLVGRLPVCSVGMYVYCFGLTRCKKHLTLPQGSM